MNQWSSYLGFGNIPGSTNYANQASRDYMGIWDNAWQAFLAPYLQQFGGTPFADLLSSRQGQYQIRNMFDAENARRIAQGGGLMSQLRPDDWLLGLVQGNTGGPQNDRRPGLGTPPPRNGFDPMAWYMSQSPQQRGEGRPSNPFTRWLTF